VNQEAISADLGDSIALGMIVKKAKLYYQLFDVFTALTMTIVDF
jgi:hypothetical protein